MNKLKAMEIFVAIADHGSLSAAARAENTSLPTVVRILASLEETLGVRLANRSTRRIALTDEGSRYLENCRDILRAIDEAEASLRNEGKELRGQIVITAPVLFGQIYVAPAITRFAQRHPRVRCILSLSDHILNLLEERMDIAVRIGVLEDSSLIAQQIGKVRRVVVASPDYLRQASCPMHPRDLNGASCIAFSAAAQSWWSFDDQGRTISLTPQGNLEFSHVACAIDACLAGSGFGMFFSYQVAEHLRKGTLVAVLENFEFPPCPVSIAYPHSRLIPARTKALINWLKEDITPILESALS
ncbi:LysR family transcriptional regulator [bacterium]|nr:LysR family transcriptional regulator [bacterium]